MNVFYGFLVIIALICLKPNGKNIYVEELKINIFKMFHINVRYKEKRFKGNKPSKRKSKKK